MVQSLLDFLKILTTPERLIELLTTVLGGPLGYLMLFGIVFAETGLLLGFFLPGDSLLFTVGVVVGAGHLNFPLIVLLLIAAAIIGDSTGYLLGRRTGPAIFSRPDSKLFKQEYVRRTEEFYAKHGGKTIIYARFVPIVRSFAPFMAGVGRMQYKTFLPYSVIGGIVWITSMTSLGYLLGNIPIVRRHFEKVVIAIVLISVMPVVMEYFKGRKQQAGGPA